jgi:hypothetical protein
MPAGLKARVSRLGGFSCHGCFLGGGNTTGLLNIYVVAKADFTPGKWTSAPEGATQAISLATSKIKSYEATISRKYLES